MKKHGFTLIELIAVIALMAVVLGITAMMFAQLFDFQQNNSEHSTATQAVNRLVADFRNDVRTYGKPEILSEGETLLRWTTETVVIEYTVQPGEFPDQRNIHRTVRQDDQPVRFETYRLPDRSALRFVDGKDDDAGLIALSLWTAPQGTEMPNFDELNPFDRTIPKSLEERFDPKYAGNWRTIVVRY